MSSTATDSHRIDAGHRQIQATLYRPVGEGRRPGILFMHEIFGVRSWVREDAQDLASEGYVVLVPDLYSDMGGLRFCLREFFSQAGRANHSDNPALQEVFTVLDYLKALPDVDPQRIGALGQCLTGGYALHLARRPEVKAPVVYHHSLGLSGAGIAPADAQEIAGPVQGHYGEHDPVFCPRRRQHALRELLGERFDYHLHPGIGHGIRSRYRSTPEGRLAWEQTKAFFAQQLAA